MTDQSVEAANRAAQEAAGPPPAPHALTDSGLTDRPESFVKRFVDKITDLLGGNSKRNKLS